MNHLQTVQRRQAGGIDRMQQNFVAPLRRREAPELPANAEITYTIDAPAHATQHVEMRTSAVDRAKGFLLVSVPMYALFGTAVVAVCILGWEVPLTSLATLAIFTLSFLAAWVVGYGWTLHVSPEGVSLYEAKQKWGLIERERCARWKAWYRMNGETDEFDEYV